MSGPKALPDDPEFWHYLFYTSSQWGLVTYEQVMKHVWMEFSTIQMRSIVDIFDSGNILTNISHLLLLKHTIKIVCNSNNI